MRIELNKSILQLLVAEVLLQTGFEKTTEHSLNVLTEISIFYLENLIKKIQPIKDLHSDFLIKELLTVYSDEKYQFKELLSFFMQQKNLIGEKDKETESLLHLLKCLPNSIDSQGVIKSNKTLSLEEKRIEVHEVKMDDFMSKFIEKCSKEPKNRTVENYKFDCLKILQNINENEIVNYKIDNISYKENIVGYKDDILAEQELFLEDYKNTNISEYV